MIKTIFRVTICNFTCSQYQFFKYMYVLNNYLKINHTLFHVSKSNIYYFYKTLVYEIINI